VILDTARVFPVGASSLHLTQLSHIKPRARSFDALSIKLKENKMIEKS
jgi:hypothetical protein